jgi:hypothetical protein
MTTLYRGVPQQLKFQPEAITSKNGKRVEFKSETHGTIEHIKGGKRNWRYTDYELQVQGINGYWLSEFEKWTPYHAAIDWAVEQRRLRRYVAEIQSDKVIELDAVRRNKVDEKSDNSTLYEYAISYYTEVSEEGIPTEEKIKFHTPYLFDDYSIICYMNLIIPGSVVMEWNLCNSDFDEF